MEKQLINWEKLWDQKSNKNHMAAMGRSSYDLSDFLKYSSDVIKNLRPFNNNINFLDCGGGSGIFSWIIYPFVKKIFLIDFSDKFTKLAKHRFKKQNKIKIYKKDIRNIKFGKNIKFDRILFGSVLQYLNSHQEIENLFKALNFISKKNVKILFTHNPDILRKKNHLNSYKKLNWNKKRIIKVKKIENLRLWLNFKILKKISKDNNFKIKKINIDKNLYGSNHMFDFLIYK